MALPPLLGTLGKAAIVAVLVVPPTAIWLSGGFGDDGGERPPPEPAPLATLARREAPAVPSSRLPPPADSVPVPAPPVTVGPGSVTLPPAAPGAAPVPAPREGQVVGEPQGIPDPNRSEATPR